MVSGVLTKLYGPYIVKLVKLVSLWGNKVRGFVFHHLAIASPQARFEAHIVQAHFYPVPQQRPLDYKGLEELQGFTPVKAVLDHNKLSSSRRPWGM